MDTVSFLPHNLPSSLPLSACGTLLNILLRKREVKHSAKMLEKAETFAKDLAAEFKRMAGDGVNFETYVILKRDNQALKTQLAEIKQVTSRPSTSRFAMLQ